MKYHLRHSVLKSHHRIDSAMPKLKFPMCCSGYRLAGILLAIAVLITLAVFIPEYSTRRLPGSSIAPTTSGGKERIIHNEKAALEFLRELSSIENNYQSFISTDGVFGSFFDLAEASRNDPNPLLPPDLLPGESENHASRNGYYFQLILHAGNSRFCAYAWPMQRGTTGNLTYFLSEGDIYAVEGVYDGLNSPPPANAAWQGEPFQSASRNLNKPCNDKQLWKEVPDTE